jgi:hypothetical protein
MVTFPYWAYAALLAGFIVFTPTLLAALMVSRSVHGRELALSPMECQVNTHSAPDAVDLSQIVTLVSHNYVKSLRHGIYEHENCAKVISDWIRSKLGAQCMRQEIGVVPAREAIHGPARVGVAPG